MKICWDNIKDIYLSRNGNLRLGGQIYIEVDACVVCGDPYLARKFHFEKGLDRFCSNECCSKSRIGSKHTKETKEKISRSNQGRRPSMLGMRHKTSSKLKMSIRQLGEKHHNYKGGVSYDNIPLFDTYANKIEYAEPVSFIYENDMKILQVKCSRCGVWFTPDTPAVWRRIMCMEGRKPGECRFYCSEACKNMCEVFNQKVYPKDYDIDGVGSDLSVWRRQVLKRENYVCEYCGAVATAAHHERPKKLEPHFALDPDNGIACCEECHYKYGHKGTCSTGSLASIVCGKGGK